MDRDSHSADTKYLITARSSVNLGLLPMSEKNTTHIALSYLSYQKTNFQRSVDQCEFL